MRFSIRSLVRTLAMAVLVAGGAAALGEGPLAEGAPKVGDAAPEVAAKAWLHAEGTPSLAALRGKVVLVEFWATWCPPCRKSIPHLSALAAKHAKAGLVVLGLTTEAKAVVERFETKIAIGYPVGLESASGEAYGVEGVPVAFLVGRDGRVLWRGQPLDAAFEGEVERALAAKEAVPGGK